MTVRASPDGPPPPPPGADATPAPGAAGRLARWGLPELRGNGGLLAAMTTDALGTGFFLPFSLVFFTTVGEIPLATVGVALTVSRLVGIPASVAAGMLVDRYGAKRVAVAGMVARGCAYGCYLLVSGPATLFAGTVVAACCDKAYWAAHPVLIGAVAEGSQRDRWFGAVDSVRNFGIGLGGLAAGLVMSVLPSSGLSVVVAVNAGSFLVSAACLARQPIHDAPARRRKERAARRLVFADRAFAMLTSAKTLMAVCLLAVPTIVPVYLLDVLHTPPWTASMLFVVNCALVVVAQGPVVARTEKWRRTRTLLVSAALQAGSMAVFAVALATSHHAVVATVTATVAMVVFTLGEVTAGPASDALALDLTPDEGRGRYLASYNMSWTVASVAVPVLSTVLLASGAEWLWLALGATAVAAGGLTRRLEKETALSAGRALAPDSTGTVHASSP